VVRLELWAFPNEEDWNWASDAVRQIGVTKYTYYLYGHQVIAVGRSACDTTAIGAILLGGWSIGGYSMTQYVGLDVSQRMTAICIVDEVGRRIWGSVAIFR
jgi:hypothetical protein